jgi:hypothetical protein
MSSREKENLKPGELSNQERDELRKLRKRQVFGPWSEADRQRFLELSAKEEAGRSPLSSQERAEYIELTKRQTSGEKWTPEDARRLSELQRRVDEERRESDN